MEMEKALFLFQVLLISKDISVGDTSSSDDEVEHGKKRSYNAWSSGMKGQFAEIYRNIPPNEPHHFKRVMNKWFELHPDSNDTENALYHRYGIISRKTDENSLEKVVAQKKKSHNTWSSQMDAQLAGIYRKTKNDGPYHFDRVKGEWYNQNLYLNITETALYHRYLNISHRIERKGERPKRDFKWDKEKYADLVDAYLHTSPFQRNASVGLGDEWKHRYPDSPNFNNGYLTKRARYWIEKQKLNVEGESSKRLFEWTTRKDSDVYHIHHVTLPEGRRQPIYMHKIWADLHPNYRDLTYEQLAERVKYLQKHPRDEDFPWTSGQKQELLDLYHSTNPGLANQGQRIYDIWSKIHPRYSFMTPYYLQIHASTIAHHKDMKAGERKKIIRLTDEQLRNLIDMYSRLREPNKPLYNFHKAWVQEYPSLAYLTIPNLSNRLRSRNHFFKSSIEKDKEQLELRQKGHKYTPEEKAQLFEAYSRTFPREYEHSKLLRQKWFDDHKNAADVSSKSLKRMVNKWKQEQQDRKGKAPMVIPKTEVESETGSSAPDMSE